MMRAVVLAALVALSACSQATQAESVAAGEADAPAVAVVEVQPDGGAGAIRASGLIGYRREPSLSFSAPGIITSLAVDAGDVVRRGQRIATLQRTIAGANPGEAALARANAERDLQRTQDLYDRGFVSEARLESARLALERARDFIVLNAPADGVVLRRSAEPAQMVNAGAPVFVLGETASGVVVRVPAPAAQAARIKVGDSAHARVRDVSDVARAGRVTRVGAKGDERTGAFEVEIELADAAGLRSGMVAETEIAAAGAPEEAAALIVPTLSLMDARADQGVVLVVDEAGLAHRRAVRTGGVTQAGVVILDGLNAGERVVAAGAAYVRDGQRVRIMQQP